MATKPASLPTWATSATGLSRRTDPGGSAADGFAVADKPPAQWINFILGFIGEWLTYVSASFRTDGAGVRYADRVLTISPAAMTSNSVDWVFSPVAGAACQQIAAGANKVLIVPLNVAIGDRLKEITVRVHTSVGVTMKLFDQNTTAFTVAQIGATKTSVATDETLTLTGLTTVAAAGHSYFIEIVSVASLDCIRGATLTTDCVT